MHTRKMDQKSHTQRYPFDAFESKEYASLIVRLWQEQPGDTGRENLCWRSEIEHIQSGEHWDLSSLQELEAFLKDFLRQLEGNM